MSGIVPTKREIELRGMLGLGVLYGLAGLSTDNSALLFAALSDVRDAILQECAHAETLTASQVFDLWEQERQKRGRNA